MFLKTLTTLFENADHQIFIRNQILDKQMYKEHDNVNTSHKVS